MASGVTIFGKIKRVVFSIILVFMIAGFSSLLGVISVVWYQVYFGDITELKKSTILAKINEETTIYTLDEQTRIGSFFESSHRSYVPIENIPAYMIRAMVASEDKNFYNHIGIDPVAIFSAFMEGVRNKFRFRRGGSTITQQTVKNIMDRREHTFKRKFKEMIRALQLERIYSKRQILEFYMNQFHVTANGRGVGIAAQYYFNKDVRDLTLVEAAFIAGSVKAPSKYNPFIKYTKEKREKAWLLADQRKNYVLRRMYQQGWISQEELEEAWDQKVPFQKGKFRTKDVALVSVIRNQLNKREILEALNMDNHRELDHAGLKIYTTLDSKLQERAQLMMRRNLSRLDFILHGFKPEDPKKFKPLRSLEEEQFYYGKIERIVNRGTEKFIELDFGLPKGIIPYESLVRTAKLLNLPTYKGYKYHLKEILDRLKVGDILFVEVKQFDKKNHRAVLELRKYPNINGGIIAVDQGEVRAVVAGFEAIGFNRAMFATRQPGSVFKCVVYYAALQLGWNIIDRIDNERRVFTFQGKFYYPRPDHISPYPEVTMLWAGIKSENLASIYLTANLVAKLNFSQFKELMKTMDLVPKKGESPADYHYRVAKETGVQLDNEGVEEYLLEQAIQDIGPDLIFARQTKLLRKLSKMWWGRGYLAELKNLYELPNDKVSDKERNLRINLLKNNYNRLSRLAEQLTNDWEILAQRVRFSGAEGVFSDEVTKALLSRFRVLSSTRGVPTLGYIRTLEGEDIYADSPNEDHEFVLEPPPGRALSALDVQAIWGDAGVFGEKANITVKDVKLGGFLPLKYYSRIKQGLGVRYQAIMNRQEKYNLYRYFNHHDFRIILGLKYLVNLSRSMGVYSNLEPVLSFPLGTNVVSVAEVAKIYQTFTEGKTYRFYREGPLNQLNFIRRIEDREGNILYEPKRQEFRLTDECIAGQLTEILGKVVTHGTGRRARGELQIPLSNEANQEFANQTKKSKEIKIRLPAFGKTGTTNDYTTAYFAGFIPVPQTRGASLSVAKKSLVITSYVGYDYNKTMQRGGYRISGAYGALPVWSDFAKAIIKANNYVDYLDRLDLKLISRRVWPLAKMECAKKVRVDLPRGTIFNSMITNDVAEIFNPTDIEQEGEEYVNEFARNSSVRSSIDLAVDSNETQGTQVPLRLFKPFAKEDSFEELEIKGYESDESDGVENELDDATQIPNTTTGSDTKHMVDEKVTEVKKSVDELNKIINSGFRRKQGSSTTTAIPRRASEEKSASSKAKNTDADSVEAEDDIDDSELW